MSSSRTDLAKMGKYIAKLRKDKKYTQRQLGDMIDIPYKTISKWENGVVAPDITVLKNLADVLGVTVDEILCGEKLDNIQERNSATVDGIKLYTKFATKKILKIILIIIIIISILVSYFVYIDNYYDWHVLNFQSTSEEYFASGYITYNNEKSMIVFDKISYNSLKIGTADEPKVLKLKVSVFYDDKEIVYKEINYSDPVLLHYCFEGYYLSYEGNELIGNIDKEKITLHVSYVDEFNERSNVIVIFK